MITPAKALELARLSSLLVAMACGRRAILTAALTGARARLRDAAQDLELAADHLDLIEEITTPPRVPPRPM